MIRIISFCFLILTVSFSYAADYRVNVTSTLNLRAEPSAQSEILCKIQGGNIIEAPDTLETEWVNVVYNGQNGYLMAKYLSPATEEDLHSAQNFKRRPWYYLLDWEGDGYRWMAYVILALSLIMWFELKFIRRLTLDLTTNDGNSGAFRWFNFGLLLAFSAISIVYVYLMGNNAMWFVFDVNPWYFAVLNFIFFVYVFINLVTFCVRTVDDMVAPSRVSMKLGIIVWMLGMIVYVICHLIAHDLNNPIDLQFLYIIVGACQVVQILLIFSKALNSGNLLGGLLAIIAYAVGSAAIVVLLAPITLMVLVMALAGLVCLFVLKTSVEPGGILSDTDVPDSIGRETANSTDDCKEFEFVNPEGKRTRATQISPGSDIYNATDGYDYNFISGEFKRI